MLNKHQIDYLYEEHLFVLAVNVLEGRTSKGFRPDFYLPEIDLYIEVCAHVNGNKRSKVRQTFEFYPYLKVFILDLAVLDRIRDLDRKSLLQYFLDNYKATSYLDQPAVLKKDQVARPQPHQRLSDNLYLKRMPFKEITAEVCEVSRLMQEARNNTEYDKAFAYQRKLLRLGFDRDTHAKSKGGGGARVIKAIVHPILLKELERFEVADAKLLG